MVKVERCTFEYDLPIGEIFPTRAEGRSSGVAVMTRYSETRSRCSCGHLIILVDGHWVHKTPHPEHACTCTEPKPSEHIGMHREKPAQVRCGIATLNLSMERREGWMPGEGA
jgi:hypothetical protein